MKKIICASGDSFTQEYHQDPADRWTKLIGVTDNIAMGGASNARIFHDTIEYLSTSTPDVLIIGWSSIARDMLHLSDGQRLIVAPHRCFTEETGLDRKDVQEFYYKHLFNEFVIFRNTLNYMIHIQEFCKLKNIKLLYFRSVMSVELNSLEEIAEKAYMVRTDADIKTQGIKSNVKILQNLISKLDKNIWIGEFWSSMLNFISSKKYVISKGFDKPLPKEAVKEWAELVKKHI